MRTHCAPLVLVLAPACFAAHPEKESTYTVTSVFELAKPYNIADMTDDYQEARMLAEDANSATVEITYYPFSNNADSIGENPNWRHEYAGMSQYLRPTPTENWDEKMRADLLVELAQDSIDPAVLTDRELVRKVSRWLMRRSTFNPAFAIWYVHFPNAIPEVFAPLRAAFNKEKPSPDTTDQAMFDREVLGRQMFYNRVHGSCTSSAVLMATVMRALGIPTRIVFFVPPADGNDAKQREMLFSALHHNQVRATVRHGLPGGGFSNHLFNEVFVGNRWVRLNYDVLGQNILDEHYLGLLTHILTTDSLTHVPMAETWGSRYAEYAHAEPKLSSMNPYRLLKVSDHFGANAHIENPAIGEEELRKVTVIEAWTRDAANALLTKPVDTNADLFIGIREYIPNYTLQLRYFAQHAGKEFTLVGPDGAELKASLSGLTIRNKDKTGRQFQWFALKIAEADRAQFDPGTPYAIRPHNTSETYLWTVKDGVTVRASK